MQRVSGSLRVNGRATAQGYGKAMVSAANNTASCRGDMVYGMAGRLCCIALGHIGVDPTSAWESSKLFVQERAVGSEIWGLFGCEDARHWTERKFGVSRTYQSTGDIVQPPSGIASCSSDFVGLLSVMIPIKGSTQERKDQKVYCKIKTKPFKNDPSGR